MIGINGGRNCLGLYARNFFQPLIIKMSYLFFACYEGGQLFHLCHTHRSKNIYEAIVISYFVMIIFIRICLCLCGEMLCFLCQGLIVCYDHSAAPGCDDLIPVKAQTSEQPEGSGLFTFIQGPERLRCIFYYR